MLVTVARESDLDDINAIRAAITSDESSGHILSEIDKFEIETNDQRITFVCHQKSRAVGYLTLSATNLFLSDNDLMLEMFVSPQYQRQGIGSRLLDASMEYLHSSDLYSRLVLGVMHSNLDGIKLYERYSFRTIREDAKGKYMALDAAH